MLRALVTGGAQVAAWVTIPEGFTAAQIADAARRRRASGPRRVLSGTSCGSTIVVDGARTKNLEGFLFPSTYLVPLGASPRQVAALDDRASSIKQLPRDAAGAGAEPARHASRRR